MVSAGHFKNGRFRVPAFFWVSSCSRQDWFPVPDRHFTGNLTNIFFIANVQPLPDSRHNVVSWAIQNSAAMKKCS
jgi:hypothetical protein